MIIAPVFHYCSINLSHRQKSEILYSKTTRACAHTDGCVCALMWSLCIIFHFCVCAYLLDKPAVTLVFWHCFISIKIDAFNMSQKFH